MDMQRKERKMEYEWTKEPPTEAGSYWFCGSLYEGEKPGLYYIECWGISNGKLLVVNGNFWDPAADSGPGWFAKIDTKEIMNSLGNSMQMEIMDSLGDSVLKKGEKVNENKK